MTAMKTIRAQTAAKASVADRVAASVLQSLRDGDVVPGQRLVETETAQRTGSSRPAVREAFARLAAEGVVEFARNRGVTIRKLSPDEVRDMLTRLKGAALLRGFRGSEPVDLEVLAGIACRVAEMLADHCDLVSEVDINPVICAGSRQLVVDALIVKAV